MASTNRSVGGLWKRPLERSAKRPGMSTGSQDATTKVTIVGHGSTLYGVGLARGRPEGGWLVSEGGDRRRSGASDPTAWGLPKDLGRLDSVGSPRMQVKRGVPSVPPELAGRFPSLGATLMHQRKPVQVYLETVPPAPDAARWMWPSGWDETAQRNFANAWPSGLDAWVDELIETFGSQWHNAFQVLAPTHQRPFIRRLEQLAASKQLRLTNMYQDDVDVTVSVALSAGPAATQIERRTWPYPTVSTCNICGDQHFFDFVRYWAIRDYGGPGVCVLCREAALGLPGDPAFKNKDLDVSLAALARLAKVTGVIPPQNFRTTIKAIGLSEEARADAIAALITTPSFEFLRSRMNGAPWLSVLRAAGIIGDTWRPARGVLCEAADGHFCRSLGEKVIDDWLSRHQVPHEVEPHYPRDQALNPRGLLRADWQVGDLFIEYAGMMQDKKYSAKMASKQVLAESCGLQLLVIVPEDLYQLDHLLSGLPPSKVVQVEYRSQSR